MLLYHDIAPETSKEESVTVSVRQFEEHLQALKSNGFHIIDMEQFQAFIEKGKPVPDHSVLITFDDGYKSFYTYAYPVLRKAGATASMFVIGAYTDMFNADTRPHLSWDELRELKKNGMGILNHTYNSHLFTATTELGDELKPTFAGPLYLPHQKRMETREEFGERVRSDLAFMEKRLKDEVGEAPGMFAMPFGIYDPSVIEHGKKAGVKMFFTTEEGINKPGQEEIFRINAGMPNFSGKALVATIRKYQK